MTLLDFRPTTSSTTTRPVRRRHSAASPAATTIVSAPNSSRSNPTAPLAPQPSAPAGLRAVPAGTEARGFVLYVGLDEAAAAANGTDLGHIVQELKQFAATLAPTAQTHAVVALAPAGTGGRDVDVVRLALQEPAAVAAHRPETVSPADTKLVIDFARKSVALDGTPVTLTYTELELLDYLIRNEGRAVARAELIGGLWETQDRPGRTDQTSSPETPNERTIDVHVRRLRAKLGRYEQIVRTVRGSGYRFDQHPDVVVHFSPVGRVRSA